MLLDRADAVMPKELHEVLDPYLDKLEQELDPAKKPAGGEPQPARAERRQAERGDSRRRPLRSSRIDEATAQPTSVSESDEPHRPEPNP